jgi:hypothetical protein
MNMLNETLSCSSDCPFGRECGTRLILEHERCRSGLEEVKNYFQDIYPGYSVNFKARGQYTVIALITPNPSNLPLWILRANPKIPWTEKARINQGKVTLVE